MLPKVDEPKVVFGTPNWTSVQQIECLQTELQTDALVDRELLQQREIVLKPVGLRSLPDDLGTSPNSKAAALRKAFASR